MNLGSRRTTDKRVLNPVLPVDSTESNSILLAQDTILAEPEKTPKNKEPSAGDEAVFEIVGSSGDMEVASRSGNSSPIAVRRYLKESGPNKKFYKLIFKRFYRSNRISDRPTTLSLVNQSTDISGFIEDSTEDNAAVNVQFD